MAVWETHGFDAFRAGTFGNAGQNLYVSRAGVLQRIFRFDLGDDGYLDLVLCNSQNHSECPPTYVYTDVLGEMKRNELPARGAMSGAVVDLGGDAIVVGMHDDGVRQDLNSVIYYSGPGGWSERYQRQLPTPLSTSVAAGDFTGCGKSALAFLCNGKVRLFYQTELGFEPKRFTDLEIAGHQLNAEDLDGDGCAELIVRQRDGSLTIYWGGLDCIDPARTTAVPHAPNPADFAPLEDEQVKYAEYTDDAQPLPCVVTLDGISHLFIAAKEEGRLLPVLRDRSFGEPLIFRCRRPMAVAAGDVDGSGTTDLVFACCEPAGDSEVSWVYWADENGYSEARRTALPALHACDVAVADLNGDGCAEIVLCQSAGAETFDCEALVYAGSIDGVRSEPVRLPAHDARRVLLARPTDGGAPAVVLVNHFSGGVLGNAVVSIYANGPDGFSPEHRRDLPAWGAVESLICDLNDDGRADLVIANASENSVARDPGSYVYLNGPDGLPDAPSFTLPTARAHGVCCADLDRDGYLDLVFCGFNNAEITIFHGTADGFDTEHPTRLRMEVDGVVYDEPRWIYLADLDNDGWLDLVVPQITFDRSLILWGGPEGFSMERCQLLAVERAACARAADLTGNGYLDLVIGGHAPSLIGPHDSFVYIYWNGPDGLREDRRTQLPAAAVNALTLADFNNDGLLDLYIGSYHNGRERDIDSYVYWNRPGRGFSAHDRTRLFTHSASGCLAADFNNDGWIDLAVANHKVEGDHRGFSTIWWNGPHGFNEERVTNLPSSGPHGITAIEIGNQRDRGPEEYYTSVPYELPAGTAVTRVTWEAEIPEKTWVKAQVRCAATREELEGAAWSAWVENGEAVAGMRGWVQYRLALGAVNGLASPRVARVAVEYNK